MFCRLVVRSAFIALALGLGSAASAGVIWNESVNGDLSNDGLSPTFVGTLTPGSNQVIGLTGRPGPAPATPPERDYFFVTVPLGLNLAAITLLPGQNMGGLGFIGLQAGSQITLPTNAATAVGLLGWWHYAPADVGHDILASMSALAMTPGGMGATGFTAPLGPGNYAFWVQDTSTPPVPSIPFNFGFDLVVVPEPGTIAMMLLGLGGLGFSRRKRA
ncbi:MAG TPA: PEP-CTERM sorting domain-containing protein [Burkholderiales bacterium]|nr:PEP-CTERM sorting domain-containing protein [Burkholderiales bacterium]